MECDENDQLKKEKVLYNWGDELGIRVVVKDICSSLSYSISIRFWMNQ